MLFDLKKDPHEQNDIASAHADIVGRAMRCLDDWHGQMMRSSTSGFDPMWTVIREGGAFHTRGELPGYLKRLRETGRTQWAEKLASQHPREV